MNACVTERAGACADEADPAGLAGPGGRQEPMRTRGWTVSAAEFREIVRDLSLRYHKWDLNLQGVCRVIPESIVLSRQAHGELVRMTETLAAAIRRFEARTRRDPEAVKALGIDAALLPLLAAESPHEPAFCRADFFWTEDGRWVISEFNEDVPGGFNEAVGVAETVGEGRLGGTVEGDLKRRMVGAFDDCDAVGLVFATAFSEDLQHSSLFGRWLMEAGHEAVLGAPDQLEYRRCARLAGRRIDGAFRFYPGEWMRLLPNAEAWRRALPVLRMMSPPVRLLAQSKLAFGVWQSSYPLDPEFRPLADAVFPLTERFDLGRAEGYCAERERWVLKRAFGRMGDSVLIGAQTAPAEWAAAMRFAAASSGEYAMQECFRVQPLEFGCGMMYPTIGAYAVNGVFAGYYSRVASQPFINHEAYYVATVVEAA